MIKVNIYRSYTCYFSSLASSLTDNSVSVDSWLNKTFMITVQANIEVWGVCDSCKKWLFSLWYHKVDCQLIAQGQKLCCLFFSVAAVFGCCNHAFSGWVQMTHAMVKWLNGEMPTKMLLKGYLRPTAKSFGLKIGHCFNKWMISTMMSQLTKPER